MHRQPAFRRKMRKPFLDTYQDCETVPTRQDISNLEAHFRRRSALCRTLGLIPSHLEGKHLIEFGPGSGENSIYLASLKPGKYTLVDGTLSSIKSVTAFKTKYYPNIPVEIVESNFFDYHSDEKYDAVFCEGAIPTQLEPERLLSHIADFTKPGGVLVITCFDAVSFLPEAIRRFLARVFIGRPQLDAPT
jgi:SAM-dependent methyltransferase